MIVLKFLFASKFLDYLPVSLLSGKGLQGKGFTSSDACHETVYAYAAFGYVFFLTKLNNSDKIKLSSNVDLSTAH